MDQQQTDQPHACDALDCQQPQCLERAHEVQPSMINPADLLIRVRAGEKQGRFSVVYRFGNWDVQLQRMAIEHWTEYRDDAGAWQPVPALPSDVERPCGCRGTCASQRRDGRAVLHELWGRQGETWYLELTADKKGPTETRVYDCEWDHVFTLPGHCSPGLVFAVYGIQEEALARGKRVGERAARVAICRAIGATTREE